MGDDLDGTGGAGRVAVDNLAGEGPGLEGTMVGLGLEETMGALVCRALTEGLREIGSSALEGTLIGAAVYAVYAA